MALDFFNNDKGSKAMEEANKQLLKEKEIEKARKNREEKEKKNK